jgi:CheY-like chemotaxis protein
MSEPERTPHALAVLVVDDDPDTATSLAELLSLHGHAVRAALDGEEALRMVGEFPPDVVLLDIRMPNLDGCGVARRIRERCELARKRPLLIAITGGGSQSDRERTAAAGFDLHLVKPVEPAVLVGLLERFRRLLAPPRPESRPDAPPQELPNAWSDPTARRAEFATSAPVLAGVCRAPRG